MAAGNSIGAMRASDDDRSQVHSVLNDAYAEGRLTREEWDQRASALAARPRTPTCDRLTADLPRQYHGPAVRRAGQPGAPGLAGTGMAAQAWQTQRTNGMAIAALVLRARPAHCRLPGWDSGHHLGSQSTPPHPDDGRARRRAWHRPAWFLAIWAGWSPAAARTAVCDRGCVSGSPRVSRARPDGCSAANGPVPCLKAFRCRVRPCRPGRTGLPRPPSWARPPRSRPARPGSARARARRAPRPAGPGAWCRSAG